MQGEETTTITSETALIMERMVTLPPGEPRYQVLKAVVDYKASWVELAEQLNLIALNKDFKPWGYEKFRDYCRQELQMPPSVASKLVKNFQWIDREAPELLTRALDDSGDQGVAAKQASDRARVPDLATVDVLVKAEREVARERLSQASYDEIKARALSGERPIQEIKQELKEAIVVPEPDAGDPKVQLKMLRRSLSSAEKLVSQLTDALGEDDEELRGLAEALRERLFERVSAMLDEQAYAAALAPQTAPMRQRRSRRLRR